MPNAIAAQSSSRLVLPVAGRLETLPELLCRKEVMTFLGLSSVRALRTMIAQGKFPRPIEINMRLHRWRREDVVAWYTSNGPTNTAGPPTSSD